MLSDKLQFVEYRCPTNFSLSNIGSVTNKKKWVSLVIISPNSIAARPFVGCF
jgi:hypothetical protein